MSTELSNLLLVILGALGLVVSLFGVAIRRGIQQMSFRALILLIIGMVSAVCLGIGLYRIAIPARITPDTVEEKVKLWLDNFGVTTQKISSETSEVYFLTRVSYNDSTSIFVSRSKGLPRYLTLAARVTLAPEHKALLDKLSKEDRERFYVHLRLEMSRAGIRGTSTQDPTLDITIIRLIPITDELTEATLIDRVDAIHRDELIVIDTIALELEHKE